MLISYLWSLSGLLIIFPYPAVSHVFQGPGFSGSRFFRVQVIQDPGFSGSRFFRVNIFQGPGFQGPVAGSRVRGPGSESRVRVQVLEVALEGKIQLLADAFFRCPLK